MLGLNYLDGLSKCAADGDTVSCAAADRPAHRIFPTGSGKKTLPHAWTGRGRSRANWSDTDAPRSARGGSVTTCSDSTIYTDCLNARQMVTRCRARRRIVRRIVFSQPVPEKRPSPMPGQAGGGLAQKVRHGCSSLSPRGICHDVLGLNYLHGLSKCAADGDTVSCAAADRPAHRIFPTGSGKKTLPHAWTGRGWSRTKSPLGNMPMSKSRR